MKTGPKPSSLGYRLGLSLLSTLFCAAASSLPTANSTGALLKARSPLHPDYLPAQIGAIVAAYGVSLVLVAITLLSLAKKRREHLLAGENGLASTSHHIYSPDRPPAALFSSSLSGAPKPTVEVPNFSYPSPIRSEFGQLTVPSPTSVILIPGIDPAVDQRVVQADRAMAQQQLEEMYRHVMEHEEAKERGLTLDSPIVPAPAHQGSSSVSLASKKDKTKPKGLNLSVARGDKTQSRTSSILSALRSPRKKSVRGASISSPIMTPKSSTFAQEMDVMAPTSYAPPSTAPVPVSANSSAAPAETSPQSLESIDERISAQLGPPDSNARHLSQASAETGPPLSVAERRSRGSLVGLPASPKPGATFRHPNPPSAVRAGGALPLRAYEPAPGSPSATRHVTKQTVFERTGPLSPTTGRTPGTASAVPYSPYQPRTPCIPVTPSLITREDRRRMKRMVPKTPTTEMVQHSDDMW
ncbi:hypothetical protein CDD82_147 [Ophiocordyceps australis]|uniref:Uncharacterized protein n=1 Tax=Ophiocordyceps australis TaxID=1399860 RepID=A0A2C5ZQK8_9HYPO|nr:hypothetical protein CDD82_147 [Ophiocordyceps australis]